MAILRNDRVDVLQEYPSNKYKFLIVKDIGTECQRADSGSSSKNLDEETTLKTNRYPFPRQSVLYKRNGPESLSA